MSEVPSEPTVEVDSKANAELDRKDTVKKEEASKDEDFKPTPDPLQNVPPLEEVLKKSTTTKEVKKPAKDVFSYRHYNTYHPCSNKLLAMKWDKALRRKHLQKLSAAKADVDNSAPRPYMHLQVKLKKLQMDEDRMAQIERNNRILLEKMSHIMEMEAKDPNIHGVKHPVLHLKADIRAKRNAQIQVQNLEMIDRLKTKQPHYDHSQWESERLRNLAYLQNISSFPQRFIDLRDEYEKQLQASNETRTKKKESIEKSKDKALRQRFLVPLPPVGEAKKKKPVKEKSIPIVKNALPPIEPSSDKLEREASAPPPVLA